MIKEYLVRLKRDSKSAYQYIKSVEKEYLKGKSIFDQETFIYKFKENHSLEEIIFLYNELKSDKKTIMSFSNGLFNIVVSFYVSLFAFIGVIVGSTINFISNLTQIVINIKLELENNNNNNTTDLNNIADFIKSEIFKFIKLAISDFLDFFNILFMFGLAILLFMYLFSYKRYINKRMQYLSWLASIKEIKENETTME